MRLEPYSSFSFLASSSSIGDMVLLVTFLCHVLFVSAVEIHKSRVIADRRFEIDDFGLPGLGSIVNTTVSTLASLVEALESGTTVENGLAAVLARNASQVGTTAAARSCPDVAVLFARGTAEPGPSMLPCFIHEQRTAYASNHFMALASIQ
jgi:hypothetical protein